MSTDIASLADSIRRLREKTGAGMTECKKALTEADNDFEKAVETLRKKGLADAAKRSARTTKEGLVASYISPDGKTGAIVELNCETDPVAKTDEFRDLAAMLAKAAAEGKLASVAAAEPLVKEAALKLRENMGLKRFERFALSGAGKIACYIHSAGSKKGSMLEFSASTDAVAAHEAVSGLARELGMQVVAMGPRWVKRTDVPPAEIAKEKDIYEAQVRKEGKPEASIAKIVEGKLNKLFYQAFCLSEQMSMRDNKTPMSKLVEDAGKAAGGSVEIKRFVRYQLGGE
ncbi:MAG TPA: translation elongation factor Ts [Elusimicrobia bacterium]|nr:translation elongation factor Ts [Elusimicrobiota bacterium]